MGQDLNVKFTDEVAHNAHFNPVTNSAVGLIVQPNSPAGINHRYPLPESLPMKVVCDIHPWMDGYWTVLDHPYSAITDKDGRFKLEKLPVGEHTFCVWHERCGYVIREYQVAVVSNSHAALPTVKLTAAQLGKR